LSEPATIIPNASRRLNPRTRWQFWYLYCMTDEPTTTLDYTDNIVVPGDVFREPTNEYWALQCLGVNK
jgi:hypothetical protein